MLSSDDSSWMLWLAKLVASLAIIVGAAFANNFDSISRRRRKQLRATEEEIPGSTAFTRRSSSRDSRGPALSRKQEFLERVGEDYGYASSPRGFIDTWRKKEFPTMIAPLNLTGIYSAAALHESDRLEVYLDYAGAALPSRSQLNSIHDFSATHLLANPHSAGHAASRTLRLIEQAKQEILSHFNATPGQFSAINVRQTSGTDKAMFHPGYDVVFTSGATDALRIVAERFPWTNQSTLLYSHNAHTSVIGMRGIVLSKGGRFLCKHIKDILQIVANNDESKVEKVVSSWEQVHDTDKGNNHNHLQLKGPTHNLLVMPVECNFGGDRPNAAAVIQGIRRVNAKRQRDHSTGSDNVWSTMMDLAKAASTGPVDLKKLDPDFACLSFYKIFGYPTGLGALLVRRTATEMLVGQHVRTKNNRYFFGGGSVDVVLPYSDFAVGRHINLSSSSNPEPSTAPLSLASLVNGTVHFNGIVNLAPGFQELRDLGGMERIQIHTRCLALELTRRLRLLRHGNGRPVVILYEGWGHENHRRQQEQQQPQSQQPPFDLPGPTIAFNIMRHDGNVVGYNEVSNLAELNNPPIQLRTGCFCNPGGCQHALGLSDEEIQRNYETAGHVCGDQVDIVNGRPTGAVRASFGKESLWEDLDALVCFIEKHFVSTRKAEQHKHVTLRVPTTKFFLKEMYIYPIKSCAAQRVRKWKMDLPSGRLHFDREFALVDSVGEAMRLQQYPNMLLIRPVVDLERRTLVVSAPGMSDLVLSVDAGAQPVSERCQNSVKVCGNDCGGCLWGSFEASAWFSSYLGVPCWLARYIDGGYHNRHRQETARKSAETNQRQSFSNEQPLLLISKHAVDTLNMFLAAQNQPPVTSQHFRPNFVTAAECNAPQLSVAHLEDDWSTVEIMSERSTTRLNMCGKCARCGMVDFHPTNGKKGKTLRALADYGRRSDGSIHFGIFLQGSNDGTTRDDWVEEGAIFTCK